MRRLKEKFNLKGTEFTQLHKDDRLVIYHTTFPSVEVFEYRTGNPFKVNNYESEEFERYPKSEAFGSWAWCATSIPQFKRILDDHFIDHPQIHDIYSRVQAILREKGFR